MKTKGFIQTSLNFLKTTLLIFGCNEVHLKKSIHMAYKVTQTNMNICTTPSSTVHTNLKFMFIMDRSGSNQNRYDNNRKQLAGTDPLGERRFDAIMEFAKHFPQDSYIYWSLLNFSSQPLGGTNFQGFTNNKTSFQNFVSDQKRRTQQIDSGWTNYDGVLRRAKDLIQESINHDKRQDPHISSIYVLFFISDGEPNVGGSLQSSDAILGHIRQIISLEETHKKDVESIQVNTAYYFENPASSGARQLLNNMSLEGNGDFLEFASGEAIDFQRFAIPKQQKKFQVKEIWVTNKNTVWYKNALWPDLDSDGLANQFELILGSDPTKYDSDGNGVGDGVEYSISGEKSPCKNPDCNPKGADPYITCRSLQQPPPATQKYGDTDKDFLNNCEEKLLDTDPEDPDTNHDYIPDDLAFKNGVKINETSNAGYLDPDYDGINDYQELKYNTPSRIHNENIPGHKPLKYVGGLISSKSDQDCYAFSVSNMVTGTDSDTVRIYIMENTKTLDEKRIMRTAEKKMVEGKVSFTNSDFQ